ncbi:unnamed protein product, partial [Closterium sp. NIES-65]
YNPCKDSPCVYGTCSWDTQYVWSCSCDSGYKPITTSLTLAGKYIAGQTCI